MTLRSGKKGQRGKLEISVAPQRRKDPHVSFVLSDNVAMKPRTLCLQGKSSSQDRLWAPISSFNQLDSLPHNEHRQHLSLSSRGTLAGGVLPRWEHSALTHRIWAQVYSAWKELPTPRYQYHYRLCPIFLSPTVNKLSGQKKFRGRKGLPGLHFQVAVQQ